MIEINVTSPNLRKSGGGANLKGFQIPLEIVIGAGGGLLMLLALVHVFLLVTNISKISEQQILKGQYENLGPNKTKADEVLSELRNLQSKLKAVEELTSIRKFYWAEKLNIISDTIPKGVWLKKITLKDDMLFLDGSSFSKEKKEMGNVHSFTAALKGNADFQRNMSEFELGSIQSRSIQKIDIADFMITIKVDNSK